MKSINTRTGPVRAAGVGVALAAGGWGLLAALGGTALADTPNVAPTSSAPTSGPPGCAKSDVVIVSRNSDLTTVSVRLASASSGVSCDVSLHAYETDGPTWATSGNQRLVGFASAHLTTTAQTLSVTGSQCYGQNDLVIGTTKNDGVDGPAPHYPVQVFASTTIASWIGGSACATPPSSASAAPTTAPTTTVSPTSTVTATASPSAPSVVLPLEVSTPSLPAPSASVLGVQFEQSPPTATPPTATPPTATLPTAEQLPFTGAPVGFEAIAAAVLIGCGAVLYSIGRRRNAERSSLRNDGVG